MASRAFGSPRSRDMVIIAPPTPTLVSVRKAPNQMATKHDHAPPMETMAPGAIRGSDVNYHDWVNERMAFRKDLDNIGNLSKWFNNKPTMSELEVRVMERERKTERTPAPHKVLQRYSLIQPETHKEGMQDEEVLAIMRTVCTGNPTQGAHSQPSSLGGTTGQAVDFFRRQCLAEYLDSLDRCQARGVTINQSTLQRALLHPGDHVLGGPECPVLRQAGSAPLPGWGGRLRGWIGGNGTDTLREETEEEENVLEEEENVLEEEENVLEEEENVLEEEAEVREEMNMGELSCRRANPNAFWPGQEDHVRLYLPQVGALPTGVLFQHIVRTPAPSPGNWPVNRSGYFTSGDVDGHKAYSL